MLTKHIFDYHPIPEKKQTEGVEDIEFQRGWKKHAEIPESIKQEVDFLGVIKKKPCGFSIGLGCLVLEFLWGVAKICGICESLFSKGKWWVFSEMYICIINPLPPRLFEFSLE